MSIKYFLDFEASSLSWESYPIEISWGSSVENIKSYLISPKNIQDWTDWSDEAQKLHGIERNILIQDGLDPSSVCKEFVKSITDAEFYSDNPCWDAMWLYKLFFFSGHPIPSADIKHIDELLIQTVCPTKKDRVKGFYDCLKLKSKARQIVKTQHRAAADVEYLVNLYQLAKRKTNL